ncbi:ankyrin, partial [Auricularia subglabra TFB-10046 SS5]
SQVLRLLCDAGALHTAVDSDGRTVLHGAAKMGHTDAVAVLLEKGADPNAVDKKGRTPL